MLHHRSRERLLLVATVMSNTHHHLEEGSSSSFYCWHCIPPRRPPRLHQGGADLIRPTWSVLSVVGVDCGGWLK